MICATIPTISIRSVFGTVYILTSEGNGIYTVSSSDADLGNPKKIIWFEYPGGNSSNITSPWSNLHDSLRVYI